MASPILFFGQYPTQAYFLFSALLGCKSLKTRMDVFGFPRKWAISSKKWAVNFKTQKTDN